MTLHNILFQMVQKLGGDICRFSHFGFSLIKKIPQPYPTLLYLVFNHTHTYPNHLKLDASVYHVNTQQGSPSHFSNKSYTLIIIFADNQFVHVIIK